MKNPTEVGTFVASVMVCITTIVASISCGNATASTEVYRLERDTDTDELSIVGQDMIKRRVCIVDPDEYSILTGRLDQVWQSMHKTEDGRTKLHGKRNREVIDGTEKTIYYEDGFRFTEKMAVRKTRTFDNTVRTNTFRSSVIHRKPLNISERHWKMRQMREAARTNSVRSVTIEHDPTTGKDTVR